MNDIDQFLELIVADLPYDDVTGRLQRRQHVIDRLKLEFSKDAARLAAKFADEDAGVLLDAPTAGEWIRHNCKTSRSVAYDSINVGEQLYRLPKSANAVTTGAIGFAHLSVIARTSSALDPGTRTLLAQVDVPNPSGRLLPGMASSVCPTT